MFRKQKTLKALFSSSNDIQKWVRNQSLCLQINTVAMARQEREEILARLEFTREALTIKDKQ